MIMYTNYENPTKCSYRKEERKQIVTKKMKLRLVFERIHCLLPCAEPCLRRKRLGKDQYCLN